MTPVSVLDRPRWWQWPTVLSLDAPLVTVTWQVLLAHAAAASLGWPREFVLGASVWLAYAADRWIEGWRLDPDRVRTPRHRFYVRRRWSVAAVWTAVLVADVGVAFTDLTRAEIDRGFALTAAVSAYLLWHQLAPGARRRRAPKELLIAVLLAAGVAIFQTRSPRPADLAVPAALFGLLCFANCALIAAWERDVDRSHGQTSLALQAPGRLRLIRGLPWTVAGLATLTAIAGFGPVRLASACAMGSAVSLGGVDALEARIGRAGARVLADVALLTPIVPLLWRA